MASTKHKTLERDKQKGIGQYILVFCLFLYTMFCFLPLLLVVISAFVDEKELSTTGFTYFPHKWSAQGMNAVLRYGKQLGQSYGVTILVTVVGTLFGLLIMSMFAYALSRRDFTLRKFFTVYLLIPMLFNGGMLSSYLVFTTTYHLKDSLLLLILPLCVSTMNGEYRSFFQITLPLMKPSLAAVGFMMATAYWNDWQNAYLYIASNNKKPLQLLLINIQKSIENLLNNTSIPSQVLQAMGGNIPQYSATMATVLVVIGPIVLIYPFFQKYFVKGLTVGSVKG